ncbi:MAG TPA: DUF2804 domain-containing protein [Intrasporangium sp.]|nr:DUF2804 domain-containing protein [Intrasporangium sp.]
MADVPLPQAVTHRPVPEREITAPVLLTLPDGRLNPDAVGWTRTPLVVTDGVGRGRRAWGRTKRWEYWAVTTPTHVVALTVSDLDYAAMHSIWLLDRRTGVEIAHEAVGLLSGSATLPGTLGRGAVRARTLAVRIDIDEVEGGTRLRAVGERVRVDLLAHRPEGHESLGVVVPWSRRRFQYTVKDVARPAEGTIFVDGHPEPFPAGVSWATHDHGRGRWPRAVHWNWGAGSGVTNGQVIGIQVGGRWTDGTGSVENALLVDGRLTKVSEELTWEYDPDDWMAPWRVRGEAVDLTFTPEHVRESATDLVVVSSSTHQCFGTWSGRARDENGRWVAVADVYGWAEDVRNRW